MNTFNNKEIMQKGNKTTPEECRKAQLQSLFKGMNNLARHVVEASEKNVGVTSSHHDDVYSDSDSVTEYDDLLDIEEVDDEMAEIYIQPIQ